MVVRLGCYKKEDLEEALDRAYEGEKFSAVARTSSTPLRTLFKKSKELQTTGNIVERRRGSLHSFYQSRKLIWCRYAACWFPRVPSQGAQTREQYIRTTASRNHQDRNAVPTAHQGLVRAFH
ncbi:hypothetical protein PC116_g15369 [Phytophthora cactorum]|nr:hypothetical protein PC116_g15369 [Phytophthora cactorum]